MARVGALLQKLGLREVGFVFRGFKFWIVGQQEDFWWLVGVRGLRGYCETIVCWSFFCFWVRLYFQDEIRKNWQEGFCCLGVGRRFSFMGLRQKLVQLGILFLLVWAWDVGQIGFVNYFYFQFIQVFGVVFIQVCFSGGIGQFFGFRKLTQFFRFRVGGWGWV